MARNATPWAQRARRGLLLLMALACVLVGAVVATVPLSLGDQFLFAGVTMVLLVSFRQVHRRWATIFLALLSVVVSTRYLYWRTTETLVFDNALGAVGGIGLYLAELYAWAMLFFGYLHTIWPLERPVRPLREPPETWPTVDIFIPTYHESLAIVRDTVLGALAIDYPRDKVKVYLLDDGRREEFRAFAAEAGIGYMARPDNRNAKAGNLNHALAQTSGELVAIFDCDHVATRAFLQLTVGSFLDDPRLSLIQTPHHFYSPDPFERNLESGRHLPNEGELFYGLVQGGNDLWNAAFFCGSCAVLRRSALDDIDGFAVDTVTEDAHTALKLQRKGWNTAYLNVTLAAGLATERLAVHIGQRMRWARGMTQILRRDNPMVGPGLTFWQRLCYLSAMLHFQFALPRLIFLTAPLIYLFLGQSIIAAGAVGLIAYALPHLFHSVMTTRRIQGRHRLTFWGEVYETVLAFYLVGVTIRTFLDPRAGKFNVTHKGGLLPEDYFDARIVRPHVVTAALLAIGCIFGVVKLAFPATFDVDLFSLALNIAWALFSLVILLCAIAVGREARQVRRAFRIDCQLPATLYFEDGNTLVCLTENLSMGGVAVTTPKGAAVPAADVTHVELPCGTGSEIFPARVVRRGRAGLGLFFEDMPLPQRRELVKAVLGRADAWTPEKSRLVPPPVFHSLVLIARAIAGLFRRVKMPVGRAAAGLALLLAAGTVTGLPRAEAQTTALQTEAPPAAPAAEPAAPPTPVPEAPPPAAERKLVVSLKDMGATNPLRLLGIRGEAWLPLTLRRDEVVTAAKMTLSLGYSPSLLPDLSHLSVFINGELVGSIQLLKERSGGVTVELPINPALFGAVNKINIQSIAHYTMECEDPLHSTLWTQISNTGSMLELTVQRLPRRDELSNLPAPFFDSGDMRPLSLPFVMTARPSNEKLKAAAAVAAYFGIQAGARGFDFPVSRGELPAGDAVVLATAGDDVPGLALPEIAGPTLAVVPNPVAPDHALLLILGRTGEDLVAAAQTLATGAQALTGPSSGVGTPRLPVRAPYDAPRWIAAGRPVKLGDLADPLSLQGVGLNTGTLAADFRSAPDLFAWGQDGIPLKLRYRYPDGDWLAREQSRFDVAINGKFLKSLPIVGPTELDRLRDAVTDGFVLNEATVNIPPYEVFGQNQLQFLFDLKPSKVGECQGYIPADVRSAIDPDSTLGLDGVHHFARFPNLGFFAGSSFPFSRMADLSETAVVVADDPAPEEIQAYLILMARAADATGVAPTKLTILRNVADTSRLLGRDILVIGTLPLVKSLGGLMTGAPFRIENDMLRVHAASPAERLFAFLDDDGDEAARADQILVAANSFAGLVSFRSPYAANRVVVAAIATRPGDLPPLALALRDTEQNARIGGDLAIMTGDGYASYAVGDRFWLGELPLLTQIRWYLSERPLLMVLVTVIAVLLLTLPVYAALRAVARRRLRRQGT